MTGVWVEFIELSIRLVLNFDSQFRRLDIDGFNGLTDDTSNGVEHLRCSLQLPLLQRLMKQLGPHVLETSQHIFAVILPVFINQLFYGCPIAPSSFNRDLFFVRVIVNKCPSGQAIQLTTIQTTNTGFYNSIR